MDAGTVAIVLAGLVLAATLLGVLHRATQGRARAVTGSRTVSIEGVALGPRATLLQFSTEVCAPCRATHTMLGGIATERADITHVDLDVTHRPDLAARFHIMQTPTTLILDRKGVVRARIGGAPRRESLSAELDRILMGSAA